MTHDVDLALESRVPLNEKIVYPVSLLKDDFGYLLPVSALVQENV